VSHQDLVVQPQLLEHGLLYLAEFLQDGLALLGGAQHKHLHLAELVHPVEAPVHRPCMPKTNWQITYCTMKGRGKRAQALVWHNGLLQLHVSFIYIPGFLSCPFITGSHETRKKALL